MIFYCTIPGKCYVKKNQQKIVRNRGRPRAIYTPQFREWEQMAILTLRELHFPMTIDKPMEAKFFFYFKDRQGEADLSNLIEGPQDVLKTAGIIKDDRLIHIIQARKTFGENPRIEIALFDIEASA